MIYVTDAFAKHMRRLSQDSVPKVRFKVKSSGCAQYSYQLEMIEQGQADDHLFEALGVAVYVDDWSLDKVNGTTIDLSQEGLNRRVVFRNPLAVDACGCGDSFSIRS